MNINVDVTDISLDSVIGEHRVFDGDGYSSAPMTLGEAVAKHVAEDAMKDDSYRTLRHEVLQVRTEEVRRQLEPVVAEAINAPVQQTNQFGEARGDTTTLKDLIVKEARELLAKRDDYGRGQTLLAKTVRAEVDKALRAELAEVIKEEKAKVVAAIRASAAELIADAVKRGIG